MSGGVRLLCLDIDGTLLNSRKELPDENVEAVRYARERGVESVIVTGRSVKGTEFLFEALDLPRSAVCLNGGLILYRGETIYQRAMTPEQVEQIVAVVERYESHVYLATAEFNITNVRLTAEDRRALQSGSLRARQVTCDGYARLRQAAAAHSAEIIKASVLENDGDNFERIKRALLDLDLFRVEKSDTHYVDICARDSGKASGVARLAEHLGIPLSEVMCIGDNENDADMLRAAGVGVAMGNAVEASRAAADFVTADNDACGVAKAIRHFI